jgi:hypothetical protein
MSAPPPPQIPAFDQIVKGNVTIKKLTKHKYNITFRKIGKFLIYQVWDKDNANNMNDQRHVAYISAKKWVRAFNQNNAFLDKNSKPLFTPTTIMEIDNDNYAFVIDKILFDRRDRIVFTVSTKHISLSNNSSNNLIKLPTGNFNHVRFDIDSNRDQDACKGVFYVSPAFGTLCTAVISL